MDVGEKRGKGRSHGVKRRSRGGETSEGTPGKATIPGQEIRSCKFRGSTEVGGGGVVKVEVGGGDGRCSRTQEGTQDETNCPREKGNICQRSHERRKNPQTPDGGQKKNRLGRRAKIDKLSEKA